MAGRKSDFTLPTNTLDELFSTQEERDDAKLSKIRDIPLELIDDFPDHPFKVRDDEDMIQLVESVKERGVITPATVRQKEDGRYELISGHRRKRACELAGFEALRCEVVDLDRDAATVLMVESNYQRSQILPSEKAFAYKMRLEAMNRQGQRTDLTSSPLATKLSQGRSDVELGEQVGESKDQVRRYIRLTDDAEVVGTALDLVQTTRAADHNTRVPMVGFPQHRLETYSALRGQYKNCPRFASLLWNGHRYLLLYTQELPTPGGTRQRKMGQCQSRGQEIPAEPTLRKQADDAGSPYRAEW